MTRLHTTVIDAASTTGSFVLDLGGAYSSLTLIITGSAANTARTITFEESVDGTNYTAVSGLLKSDMETLATSTTSKDQTWTFSVEDIARFKVSLTAITGGTVTVKASLS